MASAYIVSGFDAICVVGGGPLSTPIVRMISDYVDAFVAADGGANHLLTEGIAPEAVIGDLDSLSDAAKSLFTDVIHHIADQDTTDFEKVLAGVDAHRIIAIGFTGGRLDHTLAALGTMARSIEKPVVLVTEDDVSFFASNRKVTLQPPVGTRISLTPLADSWADTTGLRWPVCDAAMHPTGFSSPSNETAADQVMIHTRGPVLITLPLDCLPLALRAISRDQ